MGYGNGMSIGYQAVRSTRNAKSGVRHLTEIKLWEISLTTTGFAANDRAQADMASVKSRLTKAIVMGAAGAAENADDSWKQSRPPLPPRSTKAMRPAPTPDQYPSDRAFNEAYSRWVTEDYYGMAVDHTRTLDKHGANEREASIMSLAPSKVETHLELIAQMEQRVRAGLGTPAEIRDYYQHHGRTPDGRVLPDDSASYQRAAEAMADRIAGKLPPEED
jgi:hypothetical protein